MVDGGIAGVVRGGWSGIGDEGVCVRRGDGAGEVVGVGGGYAGGQG